MTTILTAAISERDLLNALQKAQVDAIELLRMEMSHHAVCWRSIHSYPHYTELLVDRLRLVAADISEEGRARLGDGLQWAQINLDSVSNEIQQNYASVTRRTVIVLADILDNLIDSTLGLCLLHLDPTQTSIKDVTTFKGQVSNERHLQTAVDNWERSLSGKIGTRTARITHMLTAFFPEFQPPQDIELLDNLFSARNSFTHALIRLDENMPAHVERPWTLSMVDDGFRVASEFLLAVMGSIPGDLQSPISPKP